MDKSERPMSARASSAVAATRRARFVVILDDADREDEAHVIMAAGLAIPGERWYPNRNRTRPRAVRSGKPRSAEGFPRRERSRQSLDPDRVVVDAHQEDLRRRASWPISIGESR